MPQPRAHQEKYPYDTWADGNTHTIRAGIDFASYLTVESMQKTIRYGFAKRGYKLVFRKVDYRTARITAVTDDDARTMD